MPKIVYKDKNAVVIVKPVGMPSQSDPTGDLDAMTATSELLREEGESAELWLIHRLDRTVGGLMVFARSKSFAAALSKSVTDGTFKKKYYAVTDGEANGGEMRDFIFKDSGKGKAFVVDTERRGAKLAILEYEMLDGRESENGLKTLVSVSLKTGRFHQIRVQFSSRGIPLTGDGKYGSRDKGIRTPALFAYSISSPCLNKGNPIFSMPDLSLYPWSLFDEKSYA